MARRCRVFRFCRPFSRYCGVRPSRTYRRSDRFRIRRGWGVSQQGRKETFTMNKFIAVCLLPALAGCAASGSLGALSSQTPGTLAEIEQLKTAVSTAPLAGCVATVQQADMLLKALANGTPAIPMSPTPAPPIITVPAPVLTSPVIMPAPAPPVAPSPPVMTPPSPGGPVVTPNARRHAAAPEERPIDLHVLFGPDGHLRAPLVPVVDSDRPQEL